MKVKAITAPAEEETPITRGLNMMGRIGRFTGYNDAIQDVLSLPELEGKIDIQLAIRQMALTKLRS